MIKIQKTYQNQIATLFLVTTPIGDQKEISPRTLAVLKTVPVVFCEDTRISQRLLTKFQLSKKLISFHKFNEKQKTPQVLRFLQKGMNVALITCAGTPLIADPGQQLVVAVLDYGFNVTSIGVNSPLLAALVCSGINCKKFSFHNFLLPTRLQKRQQIKQLTATQSTIVCYESVYKLRETLQIMQATIPQWQFCLARELSKHYETFYRGVISELKLKQITFKGEFTLVVAPSKTQLSNPKLIHSTSNKLKVSSFIDRIRECQLSEQQIVAVGRKVFGFSKELLQKLLIEKFRNKS